MVEKLVKHFAIHGVALAIQCERPEALELIWRNLECYAAPADEVQAGINAGRGISVTIGAGSVLYPVPLHAKRILRYGRLRNYYLGGVSYFTDYFSTLRVAHDGSSIIGNICPETARELGDKFFADLLFTVALLEALRFHGLYYLHAAALVGGGGKAILVSGNGGSGKTSLTLALARAGYGVISDDTVFMRLGEGNGVEVLGFSRPFHVPLDLARQWPGLETIAGLPAYRVGEVDKLVVTDRDLGIERAPGGYSPEAIVFPALGKDESRIGAINPAEAMAMLLPQSMSVTFQPSLAKPHLEALKRVVSGSRSFILEAGPELKADPAKSRETIERALERKP